MSATTEAAWPLAAAKKSLAIVLASITIVSVVVPSAAITVMPVARGSVVQVIGSDALPSGEDNTNF